jgi:hypothetical protein
MSEFGESLTEESIPDPGESIATPQESSPAAVPGRKGGNKGGPRAGSGRPRKGTFAPCQGDSHYARNLLSQIMRDLSQPTPLRLKAAMVIATRGNSMTPGRPPSIYVDPILEPIAPADEPVA